jgi:hypothetical protein
MENLGVKDIRGTSKALLSDKEREKEKGTRSQKAMRGREAVTAGGETHASALHTPK